MKKIIIIEGQRFEVDATADNEAIRQQGISGGFRDKRTPGLKSINY